MDLIFFLAIYGAAISVAILKSGLLIREALKDVPVLGGLVRCPACLSFWFALFASEFIWSPSASRMYGEAHWEAVLFDAFAAVTISWILHVVTERVALDHV